MVPPSRSPSVTPVSRLLGVLAVLSTAIAAGYLLAPDPLADVFFAGWVLFSVVLALVGAVGAWTNRRPLLWVAALALTGLSIMSITSLGLFIAPAALLLLVSASLLQVAGPRPEAHEAIADDPPSVREALLKALAGTGSVAVGGVLVYLGAFARELFGACATESLACAIEKANWLGIGSTVVGLVAIGVGGWLLWRQVYVAGVLASKQTG